MTVIYTANPATIIRKESSHLAFYKINEEGKEEHIRNISLDQVEVIYIFGKAVITSDAQKLCMNNGIDINYFNQFYKYIGTSNANNFKGIDLKMKQYRNYSDENLRLYYARSMVEGKIRNQIETLKYLHKHTKNTDIPLDLFDQIMLSLNYSLDQLQASKDYNQILGIEGNAAKVYFQMLSYFFIGDLKFTGRKQHPAPDPVNALLSLGYTMLTNMLTGFLISRGFEVGIGNLHTVQMCRESLSLDLVEQFRAPIVDRFVVKYCNLRTFTSDMFCTEYGTGRVVFKKDEIAKFFSLWDQMIHRVYNNFPLNSEQHPIHNLIDLILYQVDEYASSLRDDRAYSSYRFNAA